MAAHAIVRIEPSASALRRKSSGRVFIDFRADKTLVSFVQYNGRRLPLFNSVVLLAPANRDCRARADADSWPASSLYGAGWGRRRKFLHPSTAGARLTG